MTFNYKTFTTTLAFVIAVLVFVVLSIPPTHARLIACDVGQGDAILITKANTQVLIDGGPRGDLVLTCLSRHMPFWDRQIDLIVFTNTDFDHLNGLSSVLDRYSVGHIVTGDGIGESNATTQFIDVLKNTHQNVSQVGLGDIIKVDSFHFRVLWPDKPNSSVVQALNPDINQVDRRRVLGANVVKNINERSVVLELNEGNYKALLTGDIGQPTEKTLLSLNILSDIDLLKVGHHGSKYSSSKEFLDVAMPELAIISVGAKNSYGHPTSETLGRLEAINASILRTDQEGDIVIDLRK